MSNKCKPKSFSPLQVVDWQCDAKYRACTPICYKNKYYIAKVSDATGEPDLASNSNMFVGSFEAFDGDFHKAMSECVGCCGETDDDITDVTMSVDGGALETTVDEGDTSHTGSVPLVDIAEGFCKDPASVAALKACIDTNTKYIFNQTNPVNGDGIIEFTVTPSDGGADQFITLPEPTVDTDTNNTWTSSALSSAGILTYTGVDGDGNPIAMPPVDLTPLISPALLAGDNIILDVDPNTGAVTISGTAHTVDTDTFVTYDAVQTTDGDGVTTTTITVTPAEGGTPVVTEIVSNVSPSMADACGNVIDIPNAQFILKGMYDPISVSTPNRATVVHPRSSIGFSQGWTEVDRVNAVATLNNPHCVVVPMHYHIGGRNDAVFDEDNFPTTETNGFNSRIVFYINGTKYTAQETVENVSTVMDTDRDYDQHTVIVNLPAGGTHVVDVAVEYLFRGALPPIELYTNLGNLTAYGVPRYGL